MDSAKSVSKPAESVNTCPRPSKVVAKETTRSFFVSDSNLYFEI